MFLKLNNGAISFGHKATSTMVLWLMIAFSFSQVAYGQASSELARLNSPAYQSRLALKALFTDVKQVAKRLVAVGERGMIVYSDDNGGNWQQAAVPVKTNLNSVFFITDKIGLAVGYDNAVLRTENGGESWSLVWSYQQAQQERLRSARQEIKLLRQSPVDGIKANESQLEAASYKLDEAQNDLRLAPYKPFFDISFADQSVGYVVGAFGYFFRTQDGGKTWTDWSSRLPNPDMYHLNTLLTINDDTLLILGEAGLAFKSTDKGESWQLLDIPYSGSLFGGIYNAHSNALLVFGLQGTVLYSSNLGNSWQKLAEKTERILFGGVFVDANRAILVGEGATTLAINTETFQQKITTYQHRRSFSELLINKDSEQIYVGASGISRLSQDGQHLAAELLPISNK